MTPELRLDEAVRSLSKRPFEPTRSLKEDMPRPLLAGPGRGVSACTLGVHIQERRSACSKWSRG